MSTFQDLKEKTILKPDDNAAGLTGIHPINEILHWHNAIKRELNEILEAAKKAQHSAEGSDLSTFHIRLQFIADICNFHRFRHILFRYLVSSNIFFLNFEDMCLNLVVCAPVHHLPCYVIKIQLFDFGLVYPYFFFRVIRLSIISSKYGKIKQNSTGN